MVEEAKKKILITGIKGMLGCDLFETLKAEYQPYGIDVKDKQAPGEADFFPYDLTDKQGLESAFREIKNLWLVIHTAAFTDVDGCEQDPAKAAIVNVQGTKNIVELAQKYRTKFVYVSTDYVFNGKKGSAYTEKDIPDPLSVYGQTKLEGENFIRTNLEKFLIIRTSWLFGKKGKNFVDTIIDNARGADTLRVVDDQRGSPTYTVSLAEAIKRLIDIVFVKESKPDNFGIYHVTNSETCTWYEFAKMILALSDISTEIVPVDSSVLKRPAQRPALSVLDNGRYEQVTGHRLCSWKEALQTYLA